MILWLMLKPSKLLRVLIFIYGTLLCLAYALTLQYDNDIRQLLERGHAAVELGQFIPYGSAATSGIKSYNPGSLMSYFVGLPMLIWNSPYSALLLIFILHLIAGFAIESTLTREYNSEIGFTYFALFWCIPWRTLEINLWNPAYMLFFTAIHFYSLHKVHEQHRHRFWFSSLSLLAIVGAFQFHPSAIILAAASGLLYLKGFFRPQWKELGFGLFIGFLTLIPHFIHRFESPEFYATSTDGESTPFFSGLRLGYPMLKGILYWFRQGSFLFPSNAMEHTSFSWLQRPELEPFAIVCWKVLTYGFAAATLIFSFYATFWLIARNRGLFTLEFSRRPLAPSPKTKFVAQFTEAYSLAIFLSLALAAAAMPASFSFWHANLVFPIALITPILFLSFWIPQRKALAPKMAKIWVAIFAYFGIFTFFSAASSKYHQYPSDLDSKYQEIRGEFLKNYDND